MSPEPKNPQQIHRTPAKSLLLLLRKFAWKGKFRMKTACENCKFKQQAGQQYNYHALFTAAKVPEDCTEKWKERGELMKLLPIRRVWYKWKNRSCNKQLQSPVWAVYCHKITDTMSQVPYVLTKILITSQNFTILNQEGTLEVLNTLSISNSKNLQIINIYLL